MQTPARRVIQSQLNSENTFGKDRGTPHHSIGGSVGRQFDAVDYDFRGRFEANEVTPQPHAVMNLFMPQPIPVKYEA